MSDLIIIGVDHGYAAMKTAHFSFPTGLVEYEHEPYTQKDVLEYGGKYYVVGSARQPLQRDKTRTEDYYLLTLAAIAKELDSRSMERTAEVLLAAGLPLTSFGRDKKKFRDYLLRDGKPVYFRYEGRDYTVRFTDVMLFPQGYAAVLTQTELLDEPSVIVADIGGWTVDLMRLDNRIPNAATCRSLELGMIRCLDEIGEKARQMFGRVHDRRADREYPAGRALSAWMTASGLSSTPRRPVCPGPAFGHHGERPGCARHAAIFLGGRAAAPEAARYRHREPVPPLILDDVCLNAKGYERLVERMTGSTAHEQ